MDLPEKFLTVDEVAQLLGISVGAIYNMRTRGEIPCIKIGKRLRFDPRDIEKWIAEQKVAAEPANR